MRHRILRCHDLLLFKIHATTVDPLLSYYGTWPAAAAFRPLLLSPVKKIAGEDRVAQREGGRTGGYLEGKEGGAEVPLGDGA